MDDINVLYQNIKKRRKELNMSQQELGELVGYSGKSMISQVEKGMIDLPTTMIEKFADALYTTPASLMGFENVKIDPVSGYPIYEVDDDLISVEVPDLTPEEMEEAFDMFKHFRSLSPEKQAALRVFLEVPETDS